VTSPSDTLDPPPAPAVDDLARPAPGFLAGGGEAGALMRALDWSASPLGPPEGWPQPLRTLVGVMLGSDQPMFVAWGPARAMLYNDGYAPICGARHPWALGRPFDEVWADILDDVGPIMDRAYAGLSTRMDDIALTTRRHGYPEEAHFAFSYTPVRDEAGRVAGMFCACIETTGRVLAERRQSFILALEGRLRDLADPKAVMACAAEMLGRHLDVRRAGFGEVDDRAGTILVEHERTDGRAPPSVGLHRLDDFGPGLVAELRAGRTVAIADVAADPRTATAAAAHAAFGTRSLLAVPLVREGRLRATLHLNGTGPRAWTADEAALAEEVAARAWSAVERARAEAALQASEARLSAIFAQASAGIALTDLEGRFTLVNDRYLEIVGRTRAELTSGLRMQDISDPDDLAANLPPFRALASGGPAFDVEKRYLRPDGRVVWVRNSVGAVRGPGGAVEAVLAVSVDITKRKAAEAALAESEARFRNLADNAPVMVWVTGPDGACSYLSRSWYEFTGQSEATGLGLGWLDATHPDDRVGAERAFLAASAAREPFRLEYRLRRADGAYRWAIDAAAPRFDPDGAFLGYVGSVIDITDRKAAEDGLRRLNETLEALVAERTRERDSMWRLTTDLMLVAGFDGAVQAVNPAWTAILGWREDELAGASFFDLVHPDDLAATRAEAGRLARGLTTLRFENRYRCKDGGYRWLSWTAVPDERFIHAIARDVTAEREQARALRQAEEQLRQAQKLEAVGRLTGGIAHDFNNLLQVVRGGLRLLERPGTDPALRRRLADEVRASVDRGARLTRQLLAFSRRQALEPGPVDLAARVEAMRGLLDGSVPAGVRVEPDLPPGLWPVEADPGELELALLNLVVNARDAMPDGGRIAIRAANVAGLDGGGLRGDFVRVEVADEGTGMPPDVQARAFEPFFTTKAPGEGTGLGLAQVYGFARQSGGAALIESAPGRGTTVALLLPRSRGAAA
jgi:PAS domain S-box-containing protein